MKLIGLSEISAEALMGAEFTAASPDLPAAEPDEVHLFGFNDLRGHPEPPEASN